MLALEKQHQEVQEAALALPDEARALTIRTDQDFGAAGEFLRVRCKAVLREIDASFDPIIAAAHAAHKEAVMQKAKVAAPVLEAERVVKTAIAHYSRQKEAERRRAEEAARRAARELAEKEALERAVRLEREGRTREAEAVIEKPITPAPVVLDVPAPKAEGVSIRKQWKFRVADVSQIRPEFLVADSVKIGKVVRAMGAAATDAVGPGIEVWAEEVVSARA